MKAHTGPFPRSPKEPLEFRKMEMGRQKGFKPYSRLRNGGGPTVDVNVGSGLAPKKARPFGEEVGNTKPPKGRTKPVRGEGPPAR